MKPKQIETKWQKKWREAGVYRVDTKKKPKKKWYNLMMFPYPSAEGLHVGNMYAFTGADVFGRFKAMKGFEVFEPIGLDGFGIHSENFAIKIGKHPAEQAKVSQKRFYSQLERIGNRFSWEQRLETYDPDYYKWTQWIFIKMFEKGLAYRKKSLVNWCPSCKTVLADEQVEAGVCERCKNETEKKETYQWFFKITEYAQKLLDNIDKIDWPEKIKIAQRNWIGRKEGINIKYKVEGSDPSIDETVTCFTTRPDTNFGATFVVLGPEHKLVDKIIKGHIKVDQKVKKSIKTYREKALKKSEIDRIAEGRKKTGVDTGLVAINDLTGFKMPIYVTDFVLGHVGTGAVVGVPGHDVRDFEFAKEFGLKVIRVVVGPDGDKSKVTKVGQVQEEAGKMVNSEFLNGMEIKKAIGAMMDYLEEKKMGKKVVDYRLRDWCISRQRYWGPPIPMIECNKCGFVAEKVENLPVKLPMVKDYKPTGTGRSPLEGASRSWLEVECPKCGGKAKRETDVSDTFLDSSWYFLRYPSIQLVSPDRSDFPRATQPENQLSASRNLPIDRRITNTWLPVDAYIGGAEHAVLHLMYSRFVWMALQDWGYLDNKLGPEPFPFLYGHGLIIKDGAKMSKSRGNIVNPDEYMDKYGVDALRMYLMFIGPYDQGGDFKDAGIQGMSRFINRVDKLVKTKGKVKDKKKLELIKHKTIRKVTKAFSKLRYNVGIAVLMKYVNEMQKIGFDKQALEVLVLMLSPLVVYLTEEWWLELGGKFSVHQQDWPKFDAGLAKGETVVIVVQINGKMRGSFEVDKDKGSEKSKMIEQAKKIDNVVKHTKGKKVIKEIFVPNRLVNLVIK